MHVASRQVAMRAEAEDLDRVCDHGNVGGLGFGIRTGGTGQAWVGMCKPSLSLLMTFARYMRADWLKVCARPQRRAPPRIFLLYKNMVCGDANAPFRASRGR
eukprot:364002-Chlamydomonas_euryale.AAC.3